VEHVKNQGQKGGEKQNLLEGTTGLGAQTVEGRTPLSPYSLIERGREAVGVKRFIGVPKILLSWGHDRSSILKTSELWTDRVVGNQAPRAGVAEDKTQGASLPGRD